MNPFWIALFISFLTVPAYAYQFPTEIIEQFDDSKIVTFVDESYFASSKPWNPLTEAPPLTINGAIQAVTKHYSSRETDLSSFSISEIEVRKTPMHKGMWNYIIKARANEKTSYYFVLMNGVVVPAVAEPESYK